MNTTKNVFMITQEKYQYVSVEENALSGAVMCPTYENGPYCHVDN